MPISSEWQRGRRRESMHVWHLSGEEEMRLLLQNEKGGHCGFFFFLYHIAPISYVLKMHLQFSWHHLTFPVKGRSSKLAFLTMQSRVFFWVSHEWTHCSTTSSGFHDSFEGNFSNWFYHWTCAQSAGISADWQHILYASALWHRLMSYPSLSGGMMHTLTQIQLKLKSSP